LAGGTGDRDQIPAEALARVFGTTGPPIVRFDADSGTRRLEVAK
jgi:hypothetical protein